jgi:hypothetical protein
MQIFVCVTYIFTNTAHLALYQELASLSLQPASLLLECMLYEGRLSVEADHLRHACAKDKRYYFLYLISTFFSLVLTVHHLSAESDKKALK